MSHLSRFSKAPRSVRDARGGSYGSERFTPKRTVPQKLPSRADSGIELIYGVQSIVGALKAKKRDVYTLWMKSEMSKSVDRTTKMDRIIEMYRESTGQLPLERTTDELSQLVSGQPHQGVVLEVSTIEPPLLNELSAAQGKASKHRHHALWVALDEIQDPHNMGAILRTCVFFGVDGIVTSDHRSAPLNSTVSKTSAGALEIAPLFYPGNMARFLEDSKKNGWRVIGTALDMDMEKGSSTPRFEPPSSTKTSEMKAVEAEAIELSKPTSMDKPTILVLGNEAKGLREKIKHICDTHIKLDAVGDSGEVSSLNVSVATALLLHPLATNPSNSKNSL